MEGSDRACALIAGAYLDHALEAILTTQMLKIDATSRKNIFQGATAILPSFSSKIRMCHALGLISDDEKTHLNIIREIRNHFAHALGACAFDEVLVAKECDKLWPDDKPVARRAAERSISRAKFVARFAAFAEKLSNVFFLLLKKAGMLD